MRRLSIYCVVVLGCAALANKIAGQDCPPRLPARYTGPGSCSSPSCHGSIQPRARCSECEKSVLQNEYTTWAEKDKHAKAFDALTNPVGLRMGRILGLPHPETADKCLVCHAVDVPTKQQGQTFDHTDGVSCEGCHGPASNWLGWHTTREWNYAKSVECGMYDTRDLVKRSDKCLSCHLGDAQRFVDHKMIAAGHPDLYFELDSFEAVMPRHWKYPPENDAWIGVRTLAVGEAVQLRDSLRRLAVRARGTVWPEYSELDCFACHHSLTSADASWRQERGYPGRTPGNPPYNLSRFTVFRKVVDEVDPGADLLLDSQMHEIYKQMSSLMNDREEIAGLAKNASDTASGIAHRLVAMNFDVALGVRLMKSISGDADAISAEGERSAEQAAMALQSLFVACSATAGFKDVEALRTAIKELFRQFDLPSSYDPNKFASQLHAVNALL